MLIHCRRRSPEASLKGSPLTCTLTPGAWLAMSSRAVDDTRKTGRGSCGSGGPRGVSTQIRQAFMRPASVASPEIECLSVMAIASPAGSIPEVRRARSSERQRSASPESRRFKAYSLLFASAPDRLERFWVNFELHASLVRPLTHIEFHPCGFMSVAFVKSAAVLTVRPGPGSVANKSNDHLSGSLTSFRHRRRNLACEARIERVF
jgi:hypothetical protein